MIIAKPVRFSKIKASLAAIAACAAISTSFTFKPTNVPAPQKSVLAQQPSAQIEALFLNGWLKGDAITTKTFPVEPVETLAWEVAAKLQPSIRRPIEIRVAFRNEATPLATLSKSSARCTVLLNSNPTGWANWDFFFSEADKSEWMNIAELSIAHEIGHCADLETSQAAGIDIKRKSALSGEIFADVFATLYAHEVMGARATKPLQVLRLVREELAWSQPAHATGKFLRQLQPSIAKLGIDLEIHPADLSRLTFELTRR